VWWVAKIVGKWTPGEVTIVSTCHVGEPKKDPGNEEKETNLVGENRG
jgi:hypothetical protein